MAVANIAIRLKVLVYLRDIEKKITNRQDPIANESPSLILVHSDQLFHRFYDISNSLKMLYTK